MNEIGVFSPDSKRMVSTRGDVLDLATGETRASAFTSGRNTDIAFSPDGERLAAVTESGWVELWDSDARTRIARMPGSTVQGGAQFGGEVTSPVFSEDGSLLATLVDGGEVQLWDVGNRLTLDEPLPLTGRYIETLSFTGNTLRALSNERVHPLDLSPGRLADTVCERVGRDITEKEWQTYIPDTEYRKVC